MQIDISVSEKKAVIKVDGFEHFEVSDGGYGIRVQKSSSLSGDIATAEAFCLAQSLAFSLLRVLRSMETTE